MMKIRKRYRWMLAFIAVASFLSLLVMYSINRSIHLKYFPGTEWTGFGVAEWLSVAGAGYLLLVAIAGKWRPGSR